MFNLSQETAIIPNAKRGFGAWREVVIKSSIVSILQQWQSEDEKIQCPWVINYKGKPVSSIKRAWGCALKRAQITRRIRPYDLRHAFATQALAAGADVKAVAELMGHTTPAMIYQHYQHVLNRQKKMAVNAIPDLDLCASKMCLKNKQGASDC
jgi:integrase